MKDKKDNKMDEIRKSLPEGVTASGIFTDNDLRVLYVLSRMQERDYSDFYKEHGYFYATNKKLREEAEISNNESLKRSLDRLMEYGLISRTTGELNNPTKYVYHADAANNFTMTKKHKKSKKKGPRSEKRTHTETQAVTVQIGEGGSLFEAGGSRPESAGSLFVEGGSLFEGENRGGGNTVNEANSLKISGGSHSDGENEPNSLKMRGGSHSEADGEHSEERTQEYIYNNILYHDDHVSRGQDPREETSYGGEEKKKKIEKRNKEEEIARLNRSIDVCKAAMAEAKAAGDKARYKEAFEERKKLGLQLAELEPEDEYAKMTDDEIVKIVMDQLKNGGNLFDLPTTVKNRYMQKHS